MNSKRYGKNVCSACEGVGGWPHSGWTGETVTGEDGYDYFVRNSKLVGQWIVCNVCDKTGMRPNGQK